MDGMDRVDIVPEQINKILALYNILHKIIQIVYFYKLYIAAERAGEKLATPDGSKNSKILEIQKQDSVSKKSSKVRITFRQFN